MNTTYINESKDFSSGGQGNEVIILAGGLGTRLRSVVSDLPKCMAPVAGKPFIDHVIDLLRRQGINDIIFSVGYKSDAIIDHIQEQYPSLNAQFSIEDEPLGTGGAVKLACKLARGKHVLVLNGDTLFRIDLNRFAAFHKSNDADCSIALKPMHNFNRYGVVELNEDCRIASFKEKQQYESGLINAGVYALNVERFLKEGLPEKFSFEKDYLEQYYTKRKMMGDVHDVYFIDIGIPEDFERAQAELKEKKIDAGKIDKSWTLFLDRDGVINYEKYKDYIHTWEEFRFYEGVKEALAIFAEKFNRIVIVTNQRGIGKGLTKPENLSLIHTNMKSAIEEAGGRIDAIYFCPDLDDASPNRKPNPGMGTQALVQFPDIDLHKAIMVGNTLSDMQFGRNLGMQTVFLPTTRPEVDLSDDRIDAVYDSLLSFANDLKQVH